MNKLLLSLLLMLVSAWHTSTSAAATLSVGLGDASVGLYHQEIYTTSFRIAREGWDGQVNIVYSGFPSGVTFGPAEPTTSFLPAGQSNGRFCFVVGATTPPGSYPLTITASGNSLTASGTFTLVVKAPIYKGRVSLGYQTRRNACTWQVNATYDVDIDYSQTPARLRIYGSRASVSTAGSSCSSETRNVDVSTTVTNQFPNINQRIVLLTSSLATETAELEGNALGGFFPIHFGVGYAADNGGGGTLVPDLMVADRQELPDLYRRTSPPGSGSVTASPSSTSGYATNSVVTLTAAPSAGKMFTGWSGDITGNTNPIQITLSRDKFVTANFADNSTPSSGGKLANVSTRLPVGLGDKALIAGFIITGNQSKKVLIRGLGPSLPLPGALHDPTLELDGGARTNDDWRSSQEQEIIASTVPPSSNLESAIVATLSPGAHTATLRGRNGGTGVGLVEVYDLNLAGSEKMANISTRGFVRTGDDVLIGGFIITGAATKVIVRAIGPELIDRGVSGALPDTTLELYDANGMVASNDDWRSSQEQQIIASTVPPTDNREAAIVATLAPGGYTAIVRGKNGTTGVALVEVYALN